ncbi:hypothetical protein VCHC56A1_2639, partial [Vibrio cholerae HC-56A1]
MILIKIRIVIKN